MHRLKVHGPNLWDQSKGQFHVHTVDCADNKHYGPGKKYGGEMYSPVIEIESRRDIVEYIYPPGQFEYDGDTEWIHFDDLWVAPCVKGLK